LKLKEKETSMKKFTALRFCFLILCVLLLPGCKELFHPGSDDENNNNGNNSNNGQNGNNTGLSAPTGLSAYISDGYLYASWNAVSGAEWYEFSVSDSPNGYYEPYSERLYGTSFSGYIGDLYSDIYVKIRACKNGEQGPLSAYYHLSPEHTGTFTVNAAAQSSESIYLSWNFTGGAYYYRVLRSQSVSGSYSTIGSYITNSFFEDSGLNPGTTYYYKVEAYSSSDIKIGESDPVSAATQQAAPDNTGIPLSYNQWTSNTLSAGISHNYTFYANAGVTNYIRWDDSYDGSSAYTCDVKVSASINGVTLFSGYDDGYTSPTPVTVPSSGYVSITVEGYYSYSSGSYAIMYY
jgi:hypothetical protein